MKINAFTISMLGTAVRYVPTFERGDRETIKFAEDSKKVIDNGVTLAISDAATVLAIDKAIELLKTARTFASHDEGEAKMLRWNTGARYTKHGQRIAACEFDGGIYLVDIDRGLHYWYANTELTKANAMWLYNNNQHQHNNKYEALSVLRIKLTEYAEGAPSLHK